VPVLLPYLPPCPPPDASEHEWEVWHQLKSEHDKAWRERQHIDLVCVSIFVVVLVLVLSSGIR
jgi:hypothetical protein